MNVPLLYGSVSSSVAQDLLSANEPGVAFQRVPKQLAERYFPVQSEGQAEVMTSHDQLDLSLASEHTASGKWKVC